MYVAVGVTCASEQPPQVKALFLHVCEIEGAGDLLGLGLLFLQQRPGELCVTPPVLLTPGGRRMSVEVDVLLQEAKESIEAAQNFRSELQQRLHGLNQARKQVRPSVTSSHLTLSDPV